MDLEEEMSKVKWGRLRLEEKRMYSLQYADDVDGGGRREMKSMLERLERYLDRKGLKLNVRNTKVLRFREGGRNE